MSHTFESSAKSCSKPPPRSLRGGHHGYRRVDVSRSTSIRAAAPGAPSINMESDPPNRFAVRVENESGVLNALEYVIEARGGGTAVLRYVHSGIFGEDWENQYDSAGKHTDFYLHSLGQYVKYFPAATPPTSRSRARGLLRGRRAGRAQERAGPERDVHRGDPVRLDLPGLGTVETVLDYVNPYFVGLRSDDALYRFYAATTSADRRPGAPPLRGGRGPGEGRAGVGAAGWTGCTPDSYQDATFLLRTPLSRCRALSAGRARAE